MLQEGHLHIILNGISPLTLDLSGMDNTTVLIYQFHGGDNQKWIPTQEAEDAWTFKNVRTGKFLSIAGNPEVGVKVIGADSPTRWEVRVGAQGPDLLCIFIHNSPLSIALSDDGPISSGTLELQDGANQTWRFLIAEPS